jgi:hypothetical protein
MTIQDWAALAVSVLTIVAVVAGSIKWLVKHYLTELKPNSGSSLKDQVSRLEIALEDQRIESLESRNRHENKIDKMYEILLKHIDANSK